MLVIFFRTRASPAYGDNFVVISRVGDVRIRSFESEGLPRRLKGGTGCAQTDLSTANEMLR